jgi:hypothetical protein
VRISGKKTRTIMISVKDAFDKTKKVTGAQFILSGVLNETDILTSGSSLTRKTANAGTLNVEVSRQGYLTWKGTFTLQ